MISSARTSGQPPLAFYVVEFPNKVSNAAIPLLIHAYIVNFDDRIIMVDIGAFCDMMYTYLFETLQLAEKNRIPYVGFKLYGYNSSSRKSWDHIELLVTFGEWEARRIAKVQFLVVGCKSFTIVSSEGLHWKN